MQIIRGTTPSIIAHVNSNINLDNVEAMWVYIYQAGQVVIDKDLTNPNIEINANAKTIKVRLTQSETLSLKADVGALFQIRLRISHTSYASLAVNIAIKEAYKDGII